jgi:hypothetical protein
MASLTWEQLELPALRWVHTATVEGQEDVGTGDMGRTDGPSAVLPEVSEKELDEALRRLYEYGLIDGDRDETSGLVFWMALRPTANGLRALGEWPPGDAGSINQTVSEILRNLAEQVPEDEGTTLRQAGTAVGKFSAGTVMDVLKGEAQRLAEEAVE